MMTEEELNKYTERAENIRRSVCSINQEGQDILQNAHTIVTLIAEIRNLNARLLDIDADEKAVRYEKALLLIENVLYPIITLSDDREVVDVEIIRTLRAIAKNALSGLEE